MFKCSYRTKKVVTVYKRCRHCFLFNAWLPTRLRDAIVNVMNINLFKRKQDSVTTLAPNGLVRWLIQPVKSDVSRATFSLVPRPRRLRGQVVLGTEDETDLSSCQALSAMLARPVRRLPTCGFFSRPRRGGGVGVLVALEGTPQYSLVQPIQVSAAP